MVDTKHTNEKRILRALSGTPVPHGSNPDVAYPQLLNAFNVIVRVFVQSKTHPLLETPFKKRERVLKNGAT